MVDSNNKTKLVIVSNGITPYGTHFLKRVANELGSYQLKTIYSYEFSMGHWSIELPKKINPLILGKGDESSGKLNIKTFFNEIKKGWKLVYEIKTFNPSVLMILGYGSISHLIVIEWCKFAGIPCLLWGDSNIKGDNAENLKAFIKRLVVKRVVSSSSAFLPCGSLGSKYFQKYGARIEQIFWVPNEPDYTLLENISQKLISQITTKYNLRAGQRRIIYSGRLVSTKRVDLLIDAFVQIVDERKNWDLIIAGSGPLELELKKRIPEKICKHVIWTEFIDSAEEMAALYKLSDVLVLPSDYEPWALVINEAACVGLAIVCSDVVGAAAELLHEGKNGHLFTSSNILSLKTALLKATDDTNLPLYKMKSQAILQNWRQTTDPVKGLESALNFVLKR